MTWDGKSERRRDVDDHDTLTRLIVCMETQINTMSKHLDKFDSHVKDNDRDFKFLYKVVWIGIGGIMTLEIIFKILGK